MDDPSARITEKLDEIKAYLQPLVDREERAVELQQDVPDAVLFVGLSGVKYSVAPYEVLPGLLTVRPVTNPPGLVHVCRAAKPHPTDYLAVARYSHTVMAEIATGNASSPASANERLLHGMAWHMAALLKLQGHQTLICPGSATVSWDTIAAVADRSIPFRILDEVPRQILVDHLVPITTDQLTWVREHFERAFRLRDASNSRRFGLAFNIAYTWNHTTDPRCAMANVWSGLEALFGIQTDRPATHRLVTRIAAWLNTESERDIRDLYSHRCDAVHGRWMNDDAIIDVTRKSVDLLCRSLIRCIETEERTLPDWGS